MMELKISLEQIFSGEAEGLLCHLEDPLVSDLLLNGWRKCFVERAGILHQSKSPFEKEESYRQFLERLMAASGKRVDAQKPFLDGSLPDGTRYHLILPPLADPGPALSLRKFRPPGTLKLESFGRSAFVDKLREWILARKNLLIVGATGAGKTTLLSCLLQEVEASERVIAIEECPEIHCSLNHFLRLLARPPTPDGKAEITLRELVRNSLRMRPDRVLVGECRGPEVLDFLSAMSTGHSGCMGTLHAHSVRDALQRLEVLVSLSGAGMEPGAVKQWISGAIGAVVHLKRVGVERQIAEMAEVRGWEGQHFRLLPIEP